jgi:hypothetical protein
MGLPKLKPKRIKARIRLLKALPYRECMVYIRLVDREIFEYLAVIKGEIYTDYMVIIPEKGTKELTEEQIKLGTGLLWAGATTTIDVIQGVKLTKDQEQKARMFLEVSDKIAQK